MNRLTLNPNEAPSGFTAVLKDDINTSMVGNFCNACDWRPKCQDPNTDFEDSNNRCSSVPVISRLTGRTIERQDKCSVVFQKNTNS